MPRTTLDLDPSVLRELRRRGEREGKSMGRVASEVLATALGSSEPARPTFTWISKDLGAPRVDLEDKEAVRAILDGDA
jgi:plasmid stability protein